MGAGVSADGRGAGATGIAGRVGARGNDEGRTFTVARGGVEVRSGSSARGGGAGAVASVAAPGTGVAALRGGRSTSRPGDRGRGTVMEHAG